MNYRTALRSIVWCCAIGLIPLAAQAADIKMQQDDEGVTVKLGDQLFTRYLIKSGSKPILWPIIGPTGKPVTRGYPMQDAADQERADHPHHRSFWFTHGDVNGTSFWHEGGKSGAIVHREFVKVAGGPTGVIVTRNDWVNSDGETVCWDERTLTFGTWNESRWIDADLTVSAPDQPVKFGDTKEGSFGVRVAGSLKVDSESGGKIVNSHGHTDRDAWGKSAPWVDYYGPLAGETVGIAIMNHPSSFRFPTYWHVRTYGLFAANPFGLHNFKNSREVDGSHTLQPRESFTLRYRVLFHAGDVEQGQVAAAYDHYAKLPKSPTAKSNQAN